MGYRLNRLDEPVFMAVPKPMLTEFDIHYRLESCGSYFFDIAQHPFCLTCLDSFSPVRKTWIFSWFGSAFSAKGLTSTGDGGLILPVRETSLVTG